MDFLKSIAPYFFPVLGSIFFATEIFRAFSLRGKVAARSDKDKGSERLLWIAIMLSLFISQFIQHWPHNIGDLSFLSPWLSYTKMCYIGLVFMLGGYILRFAAINQLKEFFTVNVQIQSGHQLIQSGLYSRMRHPSYTGALLMFFGMGLCEYNWISLLVMMVPITAAFLNRINVEETALSSAFGQGYEEYSGRVKRLVPFLY